MNKSLEEFGVTYYEYSLKKHPFIKLFQELYQVDKLDQIHTTLDKSFVDRVNKTLFTNKTDDQTILHKIFYDTINNGWPEFEELYNKFIEELALEVFGADEIVYQTKPTFRVQLPNNVAVGGRAKDQSGLYGFHRDTDKEYNHPPFEKNFILPLTDAGDTASLYVETGPNSGEFYCTKMKQGQFFNFNGARCLHGNRPNKTGKTRMSFDFRIILKEDYDQAYAKTSKLTNKKFLIGDYYSLRGQRERK
tara:strand:+ start:14418 stop:15161 length:744 start_codon:yes stop_codon:yes gene_type:complete